MKPLSIRASLTAWFVLLTMLLLGGFSVTLHLSIRQALRSGLDAGLEARAETLVALCEWEEDRGEMEFELSQELSAELGAGHAGHGIDVWTWPALDLLHRSGEPIPVPTPELTWEPGPRPFAVFTSSGGAEPRRVCTLLARPSAGSRPRNRPSKPAPEVLVRVTESLTPVESQLGRVGWLIVVLVGGSVLVVLAFGFFLSHRFVRPLEELGRAAASVRAGSRSRMPRRGNEDEVDRLAGILDATFSSLEESLNRQARFTADAAHELRNPIAVIRNAAEVALRNDRTGAEYKEFLSDVLVTSKRMGDILEAMLLLARMDAVVVQSIFRDVDLLEVARESAAAMAQNHGRVRIAEETSAFVRGEAGLLRVLTDNLISNALRYSDGAPVDVEVRREQDGGVSLRVRDFGPGVPEQAKELLFERFYRGETGRPNPEGAGLGLAIVAEVARVHSAECKLENASPGTRVIVRFRPSGSDIEEQTRTW